MSRCFPYPPPAHVRNGEAVSESIKLKRGLKESITEHGKQKRKGKKSKREKKEACTADKLAQLDKSFSKREEETERSSLTEEHEQPVCSQDFCYSSDSSNKRKVGEPSYGATRTHGNVFRIRLPLQRHTEPNTTTSGRQLCSVSGVVHALPEQKQVSTTSRQEQCSSICPETVRGSTSDKAEQTQSHKVGKRKKAQKAESRYKSLFEDWVPPAFGYDSNNNFDDQQWLYDTKMQERHRDKQLKCSNQEELRHDQVWSSARFLPHADVYALPYTVLF